MGDIFFLGLLIVLTYVFLVLGLWQNGKVKLFTFCFFAFSILFSSIIAVYVISDADSIVWKETSLETRYNAIGVLNFTEEYTKEIVILEGYEHRGPMALLFSTHSSILILFEILIAYSWLINRKEDDGL